MHKLVNGVPVKMTKQEIIDFEASRVPGPKPVPKEIPAWAAKEILIEDDLLDDVILIFNGIGDEKERRKALSKFDAATVVRRDDPWVSYVIPLLGKSEAEIDAMFVRAAAL